MVWIDQRDVATQHLAEARSAVERIRADGGISRDILVALEELAAATTALAKLAGAEADADDEDQKPRSRGA